MHGKLHRTDIDQQGFLEAQQVFQLLPHTPGIRFTLYMCGGRNKNKTKSNTEEKGTG